MRAGGRRLYRPLVALHFSCCCVRRLLPAMAALLLLALRGAAVATAATAFAGPARLFGRAAAASRAAHRPLPVGYRAAAGQAAARAARAASFSTTSGKEGDDAELVDEVERALKGPCGVTRGGSQLVVAVSGGSDSVALLHLIAGVQARWQPPLRLRVAHFNHGLRLPESDEEEAFVQSLGASLAVPVHTFRWPAAERERSAGVQARSRAWRREECRRLLLEEEGGDGDGGFVVTAHQADDELETWALKLLRGAHLSHLRGMAYRVADGEAGTGRLAAADEDEDDEGDEEEEAGSQAPLVAPLVATGERRVVAFIKPLLAVPKARLVRFLQTRGLEWREDASNAVAGKYKRNRVRLELLPLMAELAGGEQALRARVGALSAQSRALDGWLAAEAGRWEQSQSQSQQQRPTELWIGEDGAALCEEAGPRLVQEEVLHRFVARATGGQLRALPYAQVDRVLARLAWDRREQQQQHAKSAAAADGGQRQGQGGGVALQWQLSLAQGWVLDRQGAVLRVSRMSAEEAEAEATLSFPDAGLELVGLPRGWHARAERLPAGDPAAETAAEDAGALVLHGLPHGTRLRCRWRRDGDRFHPAWRPAPVKLKDFLRGQRVPLHRRDEVLLLCLEEAGGVVVALVDPPRVARPFCGGEASSSEPGGAAVALWMGAQEGDGRE